MLLKKLVIGGIAAALLGGLVIGTGAWSHVRTAGGWIAQTAEDVVPLEWEIKRARQMIKDLEPEIMSNAKRIAMEKIRVAKLEREALQANERLAVAREQISQLTGDLKSGNDRFSYNGKTYTSTQVREDLARRFKALKMTDETVDSLEKMLRAREETLLAATERMEAMVAAKKQLEIEVENLEAQLEEVRAAQTSSELNLDDSTLSRTRELIDSISSRIEVERELTQAETDYFGGIELEEDTTDLLDEISTYLDSDKDGAGSTEVLTGIQL